MNLCGHRTAVASRLDGIRAWPDEKHASIRTVAAEYLRDEGFRKGEEVGLDGPLLAFVLDHALHPFLRKTVSSSVSAAAPPA